MKKLLIVLFLVFIAVSCSASVAKLTADTVALEPATGLSGLLTVDNVAAALPWLMTALSFIYSVWKSKKDGKTTMEALTLAVNTLKVEDKMVEGGFKPELIRKVDAAAEALQVSKEAKAKVEAVLKEGREVNDIKIASINGKKIYLGDLTGVGSVLAATLGRIRSIKF